MTHVVTLLVILFLLLASCGRNPASKSTPPPPDLSRKYQFYLSELESHKDSYGFVTPKGDSLLFTCLANFAGSTADYTKALVDGRPIRHPEITSADSSTPISKDMMMGVMYCAYSARDSGFVSSIREYGEKNNWDLCPDNIGFDNIPVEDRIGRCIMSPEVVYELAVMSGYLVSDIKPGLNFLDYVINYKDLRGFEAHLLVLRVGLVGLMRGYLTDRELAIVEFHSSRQPRNALYSAIYHKFSDGVQTSTEAILRDSNLFPNEALPASANRCTDYLWQREDEARDWAPCDSNKGHNGVDFIVAYRWMMI